MLCIYTEEMERVIGIGARVVGEIRSVFGGRKMATTGQLTQRKKATNIAFFLVINTLIHTY